MVGLVIKNIRKPARNFANTSRSIIVSKRNKKKQNNRLSRVQKNLVGTESSQDIMNEIMTALRDSEEQVPRPGAVYSFIYYAKTPELLYDRYPIVAVENVLSWGFKGVNLNIGEPRNYDFQRVASGFYLLKPQEVATCRNLPLRYMVQN